MPPTVRGTDMYLWSRTGKKLKLSVRNVRDWKERWRYEISDEVTAYATRGGIDDIFDAQETWLGKNAR